MMMNDFTKKNKVRRKIIWETITVFFIAISPFLYKLYDYLPEDPEATISFLGITIGNNGFADISTYMWFLLSKIVPLYLFVFWFLTSKNWWYHIILIPIAMYAFQIFEVLYSHDNSIDTENIWWLIPICMLVIPFVYLIRIKLYDKHVNGIDLEAMEAELQSLKAKQAADKKVQANRSELPEVDYRSLSEWLNEELSTARLQEHFTRLKLNLKHWLF